MTYYTTRDIAATRKHHSCQGCGKRIDAGQPAWYWAGDCDGGFGQAYYHPECRALEIEWNELVENRFDEWMTLPELLGDMEAEDRIWIEAEWPVVAARIWSK